MKNIYFKNIQKLSFSQPCTKQTLLLLLLGELPPQPQNHHARGCLLARVGGERRGEALFYGELGLRWQSGLEKYLWGLVIMFNYSDRWSVSAYVERYRLLYIISSPNFKDCLRRFAMIEWEGRERGNKVATEAGWQLWCPQPSNHHE